MRIKTDRFTQAQAADARGWPSPRLVLTDAARLLLLAAISMGIGLAANAGRKQPLAWNYRSPTQRLNDAVQTVKPMATETGSPATTFPIIELDEFQAFALEHKGTLIDARAMGFYTLGHVPGALSLPRESFAAGYDRLKDRLEASRTGEMVVYCSEADCPDAELVAGALARLGFQNLRVYKEGWEEWIRAGLPQEGNATP